MLRLENLLERAGWDIVLIGLRGLSMGIMNSAYAQMHGFTVEELIGEPVAKTLASEARTKLERIVKIAIDNGHHLYESVHIRKDGNNFPAPVDVTTLKDDTSNLSRRGLLPGHHRPEASLRKGLRETEGGKPEVAGWRFGLWPQQPRICGRCFLIIKDDSDTAISGEIVADRRQGVALWLGLVRPAPLTGLRALNRASG
jgi:PAS domain S-box-containing protein